jgi:hypothetical protein
LIREIKADEIKNLKTRYSGRQKSSKEPSPPAAPADAAQGSILQNSVSAENFSDKHK